MRVLILPIFLLLPAFAFAHDASDHYDRVQLSANAQTRVENDTVIAMLYAQEEGSDAVQLADLVNERISEAVRFVRQQDAVRLQTSGYTTNPVYHSNKITGWRVRQSIRLESRDMALMSRIIGRLQKTLALQEMNFTISPELKNRTDDKLIVEALEIFEQRARTITQQLGRRDYRIVDLNVSTSTNHFPRRNFEMAVRADAASAPSIESGEQTVQVTVSGQIELE